ncbi:hypothetical protein [Aquimarina sp. I32.4]|uniref:hypothetical protein n=1 Tax=Aquimarina sp. I32.4 TaxID=2053903 RepID=UPI000CDF2041|nr:hypothetical protein [Aquimarina sp. I32.4]
MKSFFVSWLLVLACAFSSNAMRGPVFCGGGEWYYADEYYQIVDKYLLTDPSLSSFLYCPEDHFCQDRDKKGENDNIIEWRAYLENAFSIKELIAIINKSTIDQIVKVVEHKDKTYDANLSLLSQKKKESFLRYLLFAKKTENIQSGSSNYNSWYQGEDENPVSFNKEELLEEALELYKKKNDSFVKNRFAFQIIRLCHYLGRNQDALNAFDSYLSYDASSRYIFYRSLEQKAGVLYNLKQIKESATSFAKVYRELPDRREYCSLSLRMLMQLTNADSRNLIDNAHDRDSEMFRFFNVFYGGDNDLAEAENLIKTNPNSPYLEVIVMRVIEQLQHDLFEVLSITSEHQYSFYATTEYDAKFINKLEGIVEKQSGTHAVKNKELWQIFLGFVKIYEGKTGEGSAVLQEIPKSSEYFSQAQQLLFVSKVLKIDATIDRKELDSLYQESQHNSHLNKQCYDFFINRVAKAYYTNQNTILGVLMTQGDIEKRDHLSEIAINAFQQFLDISDKTSFEKYLLTVLPADPQSYINEMRGTFFFRSNRLPEAIEQYESIKKTSLYYGKGIRGAIFSGAIREYFDRDFSIQSDQIHAQYKDLFSGNEIVDEYHKDDKLALAKMLLKIEKLANDYPDKAGEYYYMLGNAWYNLSERGWFPYALNYFYNDDRYELDYNDPTLKDLANYQAVQHADFYYKKALQTSTNKEIKAKTLFMLAKVNPCYDITGNYGNYKFELCEEHLGYFKTLLQEYSKTQFMSEVIQECAYYRYYIN